MQYFDPIILGQIVAMHSVGSPPDSMMGIRDMLGMWILQACQWWRGKGRGAQPWVALLHILPCAQQIQYPGVKLSLSPLGESSEC